MSALRNANPPPASPPPAPLLVPVGTHKGGAALPLNRPFTLIGSTASARLYLPSKAVSRCHAVVINTGGGLFVRDLASRTHTRINGQVAEDADLREGDVLQVGPFTFRFTDSSAPKVRPPALPAPAAALAVDGLSEPLPIRGRSVLIGRRETADISLTETAASSAHALIFVVDGRHLVRDLNSRTGTFVNGVKIHEQALSPGDMLRVGETSFRYLRVGASTAAAGGAAEAAAAPQPAQKTAPPPPPAPVELSNAPGPDGPSEAAGDLDFIPLEVAPLVESDPAPSPALERVEPEPGAGGNGDGPGLIELVESSPGGDDDELPSPKIATAEAEKSVGDSPEALRG